MLDVLAVGLTSNWFLGRLFDRVDIIKPVSNVRSSVGTYTSTKVSSSSMKFGMWVEVMVEVDQ